MSAGTLTVSLDFELFWAFQDSRTLDAYGPNALVNNLCVNCLIVKMALSRVSVVTSGI